MAKISPISIKYMIYAKFEAEGTLEKPDVIGAVFGQTEGLLGSDLEMRDLQKEGKIGRIEVELKEEDGKTVGTIEIPSALDKTETTLIAAAIETIERIGPSNAKITIEKIEDVRESKREYILERAKKLLAGIEKEMPKTQEIARNLRIESRTEKLIEYGEEKLPAGNLDSNEIIVVEGRADVLNLLRNNVSNVIGMDGTKLPKTIKELSYDKEITLFVDGDRGGKLIARNVISNARIDYIAFAPDGKEVEELTGKEILVSLRRKIPVNDFLKSQKFKTSEFFQNSDSRQKLKISEVSNSQSYQKIEGKEENILKNNEEKLRKLLEQVENTKYFLFLDEKLEVVKKGQIRAIFTSLSKIKDVYAIAIDKATSNIVRIAEEANVKNIIARNFASSSEKVNLISL